MKQFFSELGALLKRNRGLSIGIALGLLVGVLLLTLGFWGTLLLALLGGIGAALGRVADNGGSIFHTLLGLWKKLCLLCRALFNR